ncbi:MAG TPA: DmsC/YnfH family molybdoenzyme membrane anchor subunit [Polyangia bacterium]|jgi:Fe-S-cluster-containing dehydrogenase component/DMSO reductase anchor subunit|nr:DmsC/YnfH family molybdoenzyme membrane anchor subunit [Polyangia bacterium]
MEPSGRSTATPRLGLRSGTRPAFVFETDRCTACEACRIACGIENGGGHDTGWRKVTTFNPARHPALPTKHLSLACNHCDTAACMLGCPASAYHRDAATGAVIIDPRKCIGCRYCSWVCPYDAPRFDEARGVMTKCTFCAPRLAAGGEPACTQACPTGALALGTREDAAPDSELPLLGLGPTGLGPALKLVLPGRATPPPMLATEALAAGDDRPEQPVPPRKIHLGGEWALLVFTLIMPALTAWLGAGLRLPARGPSLASFLALGGLAMVVTTLHLGQPLRAWRAILNVRTSWLSREILLANAFLGLGTLHLLWPEPRSLGWGAFAAGLGLCVAIDGVYRAVPRLEPRRPHSAEAFLTAVFLTGCALSSPVLQVAAGAVKAALFVGRWRAGHHALPPALSGVRLVLLAASCLIVSDLWWLALGLALLGELLDRGAFYAELEPASPARRMASELLRRLPRA